MPSFAAFARSTITHVAFAFLAMGAWTLFANRTHGAAAILPALAQGTLSGLITLVLKRVLEAFARRLTGFAALILPPLTTAAVILLLLASVHTAIGTPEIAATIAVPWSVSTLYAIIYTAILARDRA